MNDKYTPIVFALLGLGVLAAVFFYLTRNPNTVPITDTEVSEEQVMEEEIMMEDQVPDDFMMQEPGDVMGETAPAPETAVNYIVTSGSASYTAQKRFFQKADAVVVGTNENVSGIGWYNQLSSIGYLGVNFLTNDFASDDGSRDADLIDNYIGDDNITVKGTISNLDVDETGTFAQVPVPLMVTFNGVTRQVVFTVSGTVTDANVVATGTSSFKVSDFGVKPPSLINVFTVDDKIELEFTVTGEALL